MVWFWPYSVDNPKGAPGAQPLAATVAYVDNDTCVNLTVHDRNGETYGLTSVYFWQGDGESPETAHCEWMPFQKGQAAKTEQLEAAARASFNDEKLA